VINEILNKFKLSNRRWIRTPSGFWKLLKMSSFSASESLVVQYFLFQAVNAQEPDIANVRVVYEDAIEFAAAKKTVFYSAVKKMIKRGMKKIRFQTYDLSEFLLKMEMRANMYNNTSYREEIYDQSL
jgi:DNA/RNA endonuclease G (NUC1)